MEQPTNNPTPSLSANPNNIASSNQSKPEDVMSNVPNIGLHTATTSNYVVDRAKRKTGSGFNLSSLGDYIVILISLGVSLALIFLVLIPQFTKYNENKSLLEESTSNLQKVTAHYDYLNSLKNLGVEFDNNVTLAKETITEIEEVPQMLNQIAVMADLSGLEIDSNNFSGASAEATPTAVSLSAPADASGSAPVAPPVVEIKPRILSVSTKLVGTYDQIIALMEKVESARRLSSVVNFDISVVEDEESTTSDVPVSSTGLDQDGLDTLLYNLEVSFNAYYMKDPDISNVPVDVLLQKPVDIDTLITRLKALTYYKLEELAPFYQEGDNNPFSSVEEEALPEEDATIEDTDTTNDEIPAGFE